jgi:predicted  nucleic acid-binding Zn-ribbon protein
VKEENLEELKKETAPLTKEEKIEIEKDVRDIIGIGPDEVKPVILDFESIRIKEPGKFEIDLVKLFRKKPLIYKIEEGKYIIDLASTFKSEREAKERKGSKK